MATPIARYVQLKLLVSDVVATEEFEVRPGLPVSTTFIAAALDAKTNDVTVTAIVSQNLVVNGLSFISLPPLLRVAPLTVMPARRQGGSGSCVCDARLTERVSRPSHFVS